MASAPATRPDAGLPDDFVSVHELVPGLVLDLRYFGTENFVGERIPGYEAERLVATEDTALALQCVQQDLAHCGLALKVFDAYRPQRAVDFFVRWAHDGSDLRTRAAYYPRIAKSDIFPHGYLLERSSHSRGSTVDLTIIDADTGAELDMGTPFDYFDPLSWPGSREVPAQQRANRMLLRAVMMGRGFEPVDEEWWHFTLRDEPYPDTYFDIPIR